MSWPQSTASLFIPRTSGKAGTCPGRFQWNLSYTDRNIAAASIQRWSATKKKKKLTFDHHMPDGIHYLGKSLVVAGVVLAVVGALLMLSGRLPWLGRLPGDILVEKKNFTFYFPLATSILISILLTLLLRFIGRR